MAGASVIVYPPRNRHLANGPVASAEILIQSHAQGFSERTLRRAKKAPGIRAFRNTTGFWAWYFPDDPEAPGDPQEPVPDPPQPVIS